ncbi:MAG TPA: prepilin-type N-terminal cleavage/methylation domain-containing protein, partial [Telluria sp.]
MKKLAYKGFTLIEIMVAMVIGMIAMIVIMQVFMMQEGTKRATTGGADAQANAGVSSYMLERDLKMSGWGMDAQTYGKCASTYTYCNGAASCGGVVGPLAGFQFASVQITDGANGGPDTLTANYYANPTIDTYRYPATTKTTSDQTLPGSDLTVTSVNGCAVGDRMLVTQAGKCTLMQITTVTTAALKMAHAPGALNPDAAYMATNTWPAYSQGASVTCLKTPTVGGGGVFQRIYTVATAKHQLRRWDNSG